MSCRNSRINGLYCDFSFSAIVVPIIADVVVLSIEKLTLTVNVTLVTNGGKPTSHYYVSPTA